MAELLKKLSRIHSVSGDEERARRLIIDEIKDKTENITTDALGNVFALKKGRKSGKKIAVTAYMDEPGFIVSGITDKGYIKFKAVGDIDPRKLVSKRITFADGLKGVIGMKAIHLQTKEERENVVKVKDLFIDIGAKDKKDVEGKVRLGEYITFDTEFELLGKNAKGKALDRSGVCLALIRALEKEPEYDFYACFLAQHEVGLRGAYVAAHRLGADAVLSLSAIETTDMYGCERKSVQLGGGVCVSYMDKSLIADRQLTDYMRGAAQKNNIKTQITALTRHTADGGAMQYAGVKALSARIPCRYAKSPVSLINIDDIESAAQYIKLFTDKIGELI